MWVEIVLSIAPFPRNSSAPFVLFLSSHRALACDGPMNQEKHSWEVSIALKRVLDMWSVEKLRVRSFGRRVPTWDLEFLHFGAARPFVEPLEFSPVGTAELRRGRWS